MRWALGCAQLLLLAIHFLAVVADADVDSLRNSGRLLAQLHQNLPAEGTTARPTAVQRAKETTSTFVRNNQNWLVWGGATLCCVLGAVLISQWAVEYRTWQQRRQQEQNEACNSYMENYASDLEVSSQPDCSAIEMAAGTAAEAAEETASTAAAGAPVKLQARRNNSLVSVAVLSSGSPRAGSPRSPGGRRLTAAVVRRSSSSLSGGITPRSPSNGNYTVDASVQARDAAAIGWAPNPHARRVGSSPGTLLSASSPGCSYTLSPGKLEYRLSAVTPRDYAASSGGDCGAERGELPMGPGGNKSPKLLSRAVTDAGLADFKLTTSVAEDESEAAAVAECSSSQERRDLHTAKSINPMDLGRVQTEEQNETEEPGPRQLQKLSSFQPQTPFAGNSSFSSSSGVLELTAEQFESEVKLLRVLGVGGAGGVHEALWRGCRVAVKLLHPSRQASPSSVDAFRREVDVMARVGTHPGVIAVLAACTIPPHMAIVVELAEKGSLHAVLHDEGLRPRYGTFLQIAEEVAVTLAHCHALKLVHRDLKTANVLLSADGSARVADFGLAAAKHRTFLTVEAGALGTASVMAPEQFAAVDVSERCDVYSYGCLLWEMLTGRQPWEECTNIMQIVMAVGCERRRPPLPPDCPPPLARLIRECWRHNAALRPGFPEIIDKLRQLRAENTRTAELAASSYGISAAEGRSPRNFNSSQFTLPHRDSAPLSRLAISSF